MKNLNEAIPKIDTQPNSNTEKDPDERCRATSP
jgi:hypothetical protein